ncbi:hypothetical protein BDR03DRAFT_952792, partial [Suillus americanus]
DSRIIVERVQADGPILQPLHAGLMDFDFTTCNPPFYSSTEDVSCSAEFKEFGPNAMITPGGDKIFVARIFSESLQLRTMCR